MTVRVSKQAFVKASLKTRHDISQHLSPLPVLFRSNCSFRSVFLYFFFFGILLIYHHPAHRQKSGIISPYFYFLIINAVTSEKCVSAFNRGCNVFFFNSTMYGVIGFFQQNEFNGF